METPNALKKSISFPSDLLEFSEGQAAAHHQNNLSRYIQHLITRDKKDTVTISKKTSAAIVDLAQQQRPSLVARLKQANLENQARILDRLLDAFTDALDNEEFDPQADYVLGNSWALLVASISNPEFFRKLIAAATGGDFEEADRILSKSPIEWQAVAEPKSKYTAKKPPEAAVIDTLNNPANPAAHKRTPTPPKQKPTAQG